MLLFFFSSYYSIQTSSIQVNKKILNGINFRIIILLINFYEGSCQSPLIPVHDETRSQFKNNLTKFSIVKLLQRRHPMKCLDKAYSYTTDNINFYNCGHLNCYYGHFFIRNSYNNNKKNCIACIP